MNRCVRPSPAQMNVRSDVRLCLSTRSQMKGRLDSYHNMLDRQATFTDLKIQRQSVPLQRSLVDTRSYAVALAERGETNMRKWKSLDDLSPFGVYEGSTYRELRQEIERVKEEYRPEKIRARKNQQLLQDGPRKGRILPQARVPFKFDALMSRKFDHEKERFVSRGSSLRSGCSDLPGILPAISKERNLVALQMQQPQQMQRSLTYVGTRR